MNERIAALAKLAVLLVVLGTPIATWAKAPTTEITISGGGLGRVVEVTDPQLLAISNVFLGQFLDPSRSPLNEGPPGVKSYEGLVLRQNGGERRTEDVRCLLLPQRGIRAGPHLSTWQGCGLGPQHRHHHSRRPRWKVELRFACVGSFNQASDCKR